MNRLAINPRRAAHRRRPIWLPLALLTLGPAALAQTYTTIDCPDSVRTSPRTSTNVLDQIVGGWSVYPECSDCFVNAFLLTNRGFESLQFPGALQTVAWGINAVGESVGEYLGQDEVSYGFLRSRRHEDD